MPTIVVRQTCRAKELGGVEVGMHLCSNPGIAVQVGAIAC